MDLLVGETWMSVNPILMINFYVETEALCFHEALFI